MNVEKQSMTGLHLENWRQLENDITELTRAQLVVISLLTLARQRKS